MDPLRCAMSVCDSQIYREQIRALAEELPEKECTVLVTGAAGMIGSSIVDAFLCADEELGGRYHVVALGRNEAKLKSRFAYADPQFLSFAVQDVVVPLRIDRPIDYIIHAASNADPVAYSLYPAETMLTNIYGANNMLEYCKEHKETRLLVTSTFETYGKIEGKDCYSETDSGEIDLNQIRSCYPESKRCTEILMRCYHQEYGLDCVIARLCSVYGPTMSKNDSKAHAQFIRNGIAGEDIVLKSEGLQKRTYAYVMDVISGILAVLFRGRSGEAYNISNEASVATIAEVARTVANICGTQVRYDLPSEVERRGFSRPQNCVLDNGKLKALGWQGKYPLEAGLRATIDILRSA